MKKVKFLPLIVCILLLAGIFTGCASAETAGGGTPNPTPSAALPSPTQASERRVTQAKSYDDISKALATFKENAATSRNYGMTGGPAASAAPAGAPASGAPVPAPALDAGSAKAETGSTGTGGGYSQTNVQIQGVDEGDIVKTDGQYIYVLRKNEFIIFKADGASTARIAALKVGADNYNSKSDIQSGKSPEAAYYVNEYATDIYVAGNTAVVVTTYATSIPYTAEALPKDAAVKTIAPVGNRQVAKIYILDITDRAKPALKADLGQDGSVLTSRLIGKTLYLISNYYIYNVQPADSESYVPKLYTGGTAKAVGPDSIMIAPSISTTSYSVVCAYDLENARLLSTASLLGGGTTVYMNKDALYIAGSTNEQKSSAPYADSVYTVVDRTMTSVTDITRFDLSGLKLAASGSVAGSLHNQFALDEWGGNLRVVTTTYSRSWSEFTDKAKGFVNTIWKDPLSANALYVLDSSLKVVGTIGNLAPGEQVQSVRFDGATGYVVTFRRVDPLFAVDLADPSKPTVKSALKIPGFSQYLHVWTKDRLFGLGMDADEKTGRTTGMKLTMFDTTNPADVTVKNSLKLDTNWSNALSNHKAILISAEKSIIAFPTDKGYDIYGYSDENGFSKRASIASPSWSGNSRGLYIGDIGYIVDTSSVTVLDMAGFKLLNRISF